MNHIDFFLTHPLACGDKNWKAKKIGYESVQIHSHTEVDDDIELSKDDADDVVDDDEVIFVRIKCIVNIAHHGFEFNIQLFFINAKCTVSKLQL